MAGRGAVIEVAKNQLEVSIDNGTNQPLPSPSLPFFSDGLSKKEPEKFSAIKSIWPDVNRLILTTD